MQSPAAFGSDNRKLMTNDSTSMNGVFNWNNNGPSSGGRGSGIGANS
jgi:hypothetical protein